MSATRSPPAAGPDPLDAAPTTPGRRLLRVLNALLLDPAHKFGSMEEQVFIEARAFRERGGLFLPLFSARPDSETLARYRDAGLEVAFLDLARFHPAALEQLVGLVRDHAIEAVDWNFFPALRNPYVWCLSVLTPRVRHFYTDHNSRTGTGGRPGRGWTATAKRLLLKRYKRVIGVSEYVVNCLRQEAVWPEIVCRPHFVNTDRFAPNPETRAEMRGRLGAEDRFVAVTIAHLIPDKGVDVAVRALAETPENVVLWAIGAGAAAGSLRALACELGVAERFRLLGLQSRVEPYLQAADVFVCPSRWAEAAGLVNVEAQATGLPVLASDTGGIPEYVADGKTGFLFPVGDHRRLAEHLRRLAAEPQRCREMGRAARDRACRDFSVAARLDDYLALYGA